MRKMSTSVMFFNADPIVVCMKKDQGLYLDKPSPAQWCVAVDFIEDNNPMSASIHQFAFVAKPTPKQISKCKRAALQTHIKELAVFKQDYPNFF